ncbi:VanZ family protein [Rathayibacter sp. SD072]|uniref:VanZ family protein n=1 Tax=Rathayibacter sp. SD072 TaxID=2781731 RepID=UPI001A9761D3|nr:VanZ family protein [Rathayibacter sp. SD072]MBO0985082.1 VanZ family protein [Rathayibacter sp. SD072]
MTRSLTRLTVAVGVPYLGALAAIAFWPVPVDSALRGCLGRLLARLDRLGLGFVDYDLIEHAANVALFVPLGLLVALHLRARWAGLAVLLGAVTSIVIETGQLLFLEARYARTDDVLMNTMGAALGTLLGVLLRALLRRRERRRRAEWDLAFAHLPAPGHGRG